MLPLLLAAVAVAAAPAPPPNDPAGHWVVDTGATVVLAFDVAHDASGWSGVWRRPAEVEIDSDSLGEVSGAAEARRATSAKPVPGGVELRFTDPRPGATPDVFRIEPVDAAHARLIYLDTRLEPLPLLRRATPPPLGPFTADAAYPVARVRPTNPEMTAIFAADQADRADVAKIDWDKVGRADEARRARTQALLEAGALHSGEDFYHAAFVFQHGGEPADYLKAHLLGMVAVARGKPAATWIASAALDRYLESLKQPQVLGTQYSQPSEAAGAGGWTQEPYDRRLLPDALRQALHVPPLSEQEATLRQMNAAKPASGS